MFSPQAGLTPISIGLSSLSVVVVIIVNYFLTRIELRRFRREQEDLTIEKRRLSEVNVSIRGGIELTPVHVPPRSGVERAFIIFRLSLENKGDGPVDILGSLVAARILTATDIGVGSRGRDVGWKDYQRLYWNTQEKLQPFIGISTTKHLTVSPDEFPRMAVKENTIIHRIDATRYIPQKEETIYIMYRVFFVARGYFLGELLEQVRDGENRRRVPSQFYSLARPNYARWSYVQKALFNINRFAFRLASGEKDPLGVLNTPNAWRMFILRHWDFIDEVDAAPSGLDVQYRYSNAVIKSFKAKQITGPDAQEYVQQQDNYPDGVLPDDWFEDRAKYDRVSGECARKLDHLVAKWNQLKDAIALLNKLSNELEMPEKSNKKHQDKEAYPYLIHTDAEYRDRWLALMNEGYLLISPTGPKGKKVFTRNNLPDEPRLLEPFVMQTRYFLFKVTLPPSSRQDATMEQVQ